MRLIAKNHITEQILSKESDRKFTEQAVVVGFTSNANFILLLFMAFNSLKTRKSDIKIDEIGSRKANSARLHNALGLVFIKVDVFQVNENAEAISLGGGIEEEGLII